MTIVISNAYNSSFIHLTIWRKRNIIPAGYLLTWSGLRIFPCVLFWPRASPRGPKSYYVVLLIEVVKTVHFFVCEAAQKGPLGGARGQAPNAIWAFFFKHLFYLKLLHWLIIFILLSNYKIIVLLTISFFFVNQLWGFYSFIF